MPRKVLAPWRHMPVHARVPPLSLTVLPLVPSSHLPTLRALSPSSLGPAGAASQESLQHAFRRACREGRLQAVRLLLARSVDVAGTNDVSGRTCLHEAAIAAHLEIITMVWRAPVRTAAYRVQTRQSLMPRMPLPTARGAWRRCERRGHARPPAAALCVHDLERSGTYGLRPLLCALSLVKALALGLSTWCPLRRAQAVRFLLGHGAELVCLDQDGLTPLLYAIREGHVATVAALLDCAAPGTAFGTRTHARGDVAARSQRALTWACARLDGGRAATLVDILGRSHLAAACEHGHAAVVQLLVERGADVNTTDGLGLTALHLSSRQGL